MEKKMRKERRLRVIKQYVFGGTSGHVTENAPEEVILNSISYNQLL